ncbi:MAG: hypothetical protein Tsb005_05810 [Gammaproteobacteria bacterium]
MEDVSVIKLPQAITSKTIADVYQMIEPVFSDKKAYSLTLKDVKNIDATGLQLLLSIKQTAQKQQLPLEFEMTDEVNQILQEFGVSDW